MAKRMRRLRAYITADGKFAGDFAKTKNHYSKEMRDRRRRGWLAKQSRKKNQKLRRLRGR